MRRNGSCRRRAVHVMPAIIPAWTTIEAEPGRIVGIASVPADAPDKPYKVKQGSAWVTKVRVGSTTRDATREEEERLYQQAGRVRYGQKPVLGSSVGDLDRGRLTDYFRRVRGDSDFPGPGDPELDEQEWRRLLCNLELAVEVSGSTYATVDGMLLFGPDAGRFVPQSGIRAVRYPGTEPDYATRADEDIRGPLIPLTAANGTIHEHGLVDRAWDFVRRNTEVTASLDGPRRIERWEYPEEAVREILGNALMHRDYSIAGTDVMLAIFEDRLEVVSPGRLPNSISVERLKTGARYARNQTLVNFMRDYRYVDALGMGIHRKVVPAMAQHNGTEPEFEEGDHHFAVRLREVAGVSAGFGRLGSRCRG